MINSRESGVSKDRTISRRMFILSAAKIILITGIVGRLFSLQISQGSKYKTLSDRNRLREWKISAQRGTIEDFFGRTIAANDQVFQLHIIPEQVENFNYLMLRLKNIVNFNSKEIERIYKKKSQQKPWETLIVSENLSWNQFSKLNLFLHELPGAKPVLSLARIYPYAQDLVHVLGYVGEASASDIKNYQFIKENHVPGLRVGKTGLEKSLEKDLIGRYGVKRFEVNAYGKRIRELDYAKGKKGKNFITTIDLEIQAYAQELIKDKSGSICVMDIYTGDVIALASAPTFNPNSFIHGISTEEWKEISTNSLKPLINKSVAGLYSPGSTIKPLVALSALEFDIANTKKKIFCSGDMEFYGQKYHCWKEKGHGYMDLKNALKQSCDIYFYDLARRLGVDRLSITAKKYGLGSEVLKNFYLEEKNGIVPNTSWKKRVVGKNWVLGETLITGIGQGYIQTTPLQLCLMTAHIANGGFKIKPRIIDDGSISYEEVQNKINEHLLNPDLKFNLDALKDKDVDFLQPMFRNQENIKFVQNAMFVSTNEPRGTSYRSRIENKKYQFAGKTGTAQVKRITEIDREANLKTFEIPYLNRDHALYIAFGPYKNPRYSLSILIEHGGSGSATAAPLAKKLFKKIIDRHEAREKTRLLRGEMI
tara:strand:+ start:4042 stop:5991 length:1950 start_codon:yes stop_codon:yes gene_type:complete